MPEGRSRRHRTTRLYRDDSYLETFTARVIGAVTEGDGLLGVELDRTAFYPTGGGQPHDTGSIEGLEVVDVQEADQGRVLHVVKGGRVPTGEVAGRIDWPRRFDHMQQHSGQHILSRAFVEVAGAATESFHLGETACTIDIAMGDPEPEVMRRAETLANRIVHANEAVEVRTLPVEEHPTLATRDVRALALGPGDPIRIIRMGSFDENPCGGTHVRRTGEVGGIAVRAWERFKGMTRVTFLCGGRVIREVDRLGAVVDACVARLSAPAAEIPAALGRIQDQIADAQRTIARQARDLAAAEAGALDATARAACGGRAIVKVIPERSVEDLQRLAREYVAAPRRLALLAATGSDGRAALVFARTREWEGTGPDLGDLLTRVCATYGGRGGGRPELARGGGMDADRADQALEEAFRLLDGPAR